MKLKTQKSYRYIILEVATEKAKEALDKKLLSHSDSLYSAVQVKKLDWSNETEIKEFVDCYNRIFISAPDPFRPITLEEAVTVLSDDRITFAAYLFNRMVGFLICYVDFQTINGKQVAIGNIAGLGTVPERRRKGIATALILASSKWFLARKVVRLRCEVFEKNTASLQLIKSFGFRYIGENILLAPSPGRPPWHAKLRKRSS